MKFFFLSLLVNFFFAKQEEVLICKSGTAYAYHSYKCRGLMECTHIIERVHLKEAIAMQRRPCQNCYGVTSLPATSSKPSNNSSCGSTTKKEHSVHERQKQMVIVGSMEVK